MFVILRLLSKYYLKDGAKEEEADEAMVLVSFGLGYRQNAWKESEGSNV